MNIIFLVTLIFTIPMTTIPHESENIPLNIIPPAPMTMINYTDRKKTCEKDCCSALLWCSAWSTLLTASSLPGVLLLASGITTGNIPIIVAGTTFVGVTTSCITTACYCSYKNKPFLP